jgi:DnaK suppressor protein
MSTMQIKTTSRKFVPFQQTLKSKRDELQARMSERINDVSVEREPDDEGGLATLSYTKDLAVATLERERQTLREIESALGRMKTGRYGTCEACDKQIPEVRLRALPWAGLCVACASRGTTDATSND